MYKNRPILSIAIPAYGRKNELKYGLQRLICNIIGRHENEVEIIISDDCSPNDDLNEVRALSEYYSFIKYRRYEKNIGLERNLIACADGCSGEFLWIFGDDDFLEEDTALDIIMQLLRENNHDFYILNRTRRSFDLSKLISDNWMRLDTEKFYEFAGLRDFCLEYGFISVIGFISVNIFRREVYQKIDASKYYGTMYPQLGAMVEAFHNKKVLLVGKPLVCHRTQTAEEKKAALGTKKTEADFMADVTKRNATYFSHPYVAMLSELVDRGAFTPDDIVAIPENTVINGLLIDFLLQTVLLSREIGTNFDSQTWLNTKNFFDKLSLDQKRQQKALEIFSPQKTSLFFDDKDSNAMASNIEQKRLTISVISPSYNQAEFLTDGLSSVRDQSYSAIEHFVYDPGSIDNSREIASSFPHVTLIAEPDSGQSDALNKGFQRVRGDIIAWLNSDDYYAHSKVFEQVVQRFLEPDSPDIVYGRGIFINEFGEKLRDVYVNKDPASLSWRLQQEDGILQPALFIRRNVIERVGLLRNDLHYCMDYEYWIRCIKSDIKFAFLDEDLAIARYHSTNKTYGMRGKSYSEVCNMLKEHFGYVNHNWLKRYAEFLAEGHDGVLANSGNAGIRDTTKLDRIYRELLFAYNGSYDSYKVISENPSMKGYGDTLREMKSLGIHPPVPCQEISLNQTSVPKRVCYTVGSRRWSFDSEWKAKEIARAHNFLRERIINRRRDVCIIVGNGPSLNQTDLSLLKDQDVIVSNNVFLSEQLMEHATYYTTVNYLVAEQSSHHINRLNKVYKVLPYWLSYCLNPGPTTFFVDAVGHSQFSKDIFKNMSWRHTVTFFNLHLAYGLGYRRVILIGFDHFYKQPQNVMEQDVIQSYDNDSNHFHPDYFRGKMWQAADVDKMEEMYALAKEAFEEDGREIINSTVGGHLELFQRLPLADALHDHLELLQKPVLLGPFQRHDAIHLDETEGVSNLFESVLNGSVMIDVGAHHGYALSPFLKMNWRIFAFEPDNNNRLELLKRLSHFQNSNLVELDVRAASNKSDSAIPYYCSEESTGVSGLSAFLASHKSEQTVDTVTLADALADKEVDKIDFLKIDTEGHDIFVLQGFPWERFKPAVIECEFEDSKTALFNYTFHDLAGFLVDKGYTVYVSEWHPIIRYGICHDWHRLTRYPCVLSDEKAWGNLLAFRDPIDDEVLITAIRKALKYDEPKLIESGAKSPRLADSMPSHSAKFPLLSSLLSKDNSFRVISDAHFNKHFRKTAANQWFYTHSNETQKLWQAVFDIHESTANRSFLASLRLKSTQAIKMTVSLGRHGKLDYEGSSKTITLMPDAPQTIYLRKEFIHPHNALKIQLEILHVEGDGKTELTIDNLAIIETLNSSRKRIPEQDLALAIGNRLLRQGDSATALSIYLLLYEKYGFTMYSTNALIAARRLGMQHLESVEELLEQIS